MKTNNMYKQYMSPVTVITPLTGYAVLKHVSGGNVRLTNGGQAGAGVKPQ